MRLPKPKIFFAALLLFFALALRAQDSDVNSATNFWKLRVSKFACKSSPALAPDGTIYQGTFDGKLLAISPDGKIRWKFSAGLEIKSSPAVGTDGTIYFGSRDKNFYALAPDGKLKWKFATGGWIDVSPAIANDGTTYFGSWDKNFYALAPDGKLKWKFATGNLIYSSPAIGADGTIYFGSHDKNFYALAPDGKLKWKFATQGEIESSPAIAADGTVYFSSLDGNFYALAPDGTERWRWHTGDFCGSSPVLDAEGNIFCGVNTSYLCLSPAGKILWQRGSACALADSFAVAANGQIYVSYPWLRVGGLGGANSDPQWEFKTDFNLSAAPNVSVDGTIYALADMDLFAVQPLTNASPLAKSVWPMWRGNPQHTGRVVLK